MSGENSKQCFFNAERACDLTCRAAFEVDDPVDNVDCHFIWLAYQLGEGLHELKRALELFGGIQGGFPPGPAGPSAGSPPPGPAAGPSSGKGPKGVSDN